MGSSARLRLFFAFFILIFLASYPRTAAAQFATPVIDGVINAGEYGTHTNGQNKFGAWYMTWDDTNLYIGIDSSNFNEGAVVYIDYDPLSPYVNGGTNAAGNLSGFNYDGAQFTSLPMRADWVAYFKNGYREYRSRDGSGGWGAPTAGFGAFATSGTNIREISIPWSNITGGVRPASFNWFGYIVSGSGFIYNGTSGSGTNPEGFVGLSATAQYYYTVSSTANGASTKPFNRLSATVTTTGSLGVSSLYDLTINGASGTTLSGSLSTFGTLSIGSGNSYVPGAGFTVGNVLIDGSLTLVSGFGNWMDVSGNWTFNTGATFIANNMVEFVGFGTQTIGGTAQTVFSGIYAANSTKLLAQNVTVISLAVDGVPTIFDIGTFTLTSTGSIISSGGGDVNFSNGSSHLPYPIQRPVVQQCQQDTPSGHTERQWDVHAEHGGKHCEC
jgi:hypothetical protein